MTTIIASGDWHGDETTAGFIRFADVRARVMDEVRPAALQSDGFIFLGDLTDPDTPRAHLAVALACEFASELAKHSVPSIWIAGNHDTTEDGHGTTTLSPLAGIARGGGMAPVDVYEEPGPAMLGDVPVLVLPYPSVANMYTPSTVIEQVFADCDLPEASPLIIAGHLWVDEGPTDGSESTSMARGRGVYWPLKPITKCFPQATLVGGHYHRAGKLRGVHIAGSLERLRFDEEHNVPSFLRLRWGPGMGAQWDVEYVPVNARAMTTVHMDGSKACERSAGHLVRIIDDGSYTPGEPGLVGVGDAVAVVVVPAVADRVLLDPGAKADVGAGERGIREVVELVVSESAYPDKPALLDRIDARLRSHGL